MTTDNPTRKPFNRERAMAGDPVITGDGREALYSFYEPRLDGTGNHCLFFIIDGIVRGFHSDGRVVASKELTNDLFMAPKKVTYWFAACEFAPGYMSIPTYAHIKKSVVEEFIASSTKCHGGVYTLHSFEVEE